MHQQTLLRLLGAPEHWDSIGPSRSDQQCHFLVRSSQESHDLSGASSPFQEWLEVLDLPDCIYLLLLPEVLERVCFQEGSGVLIRPTGHGREYAQLFAFI